MNISLLNIFDTIFVITIIASASYLSSINRAGENYHPTEVLKSVSYINDDVELLRGRHPIFTDEHNSAQISNALWALGELYPQYLCDGRIFICPTANASRSIERGLPRDIVTGLFEHSASKRREFNKFFATGKYCDYGYDPTHTAMHKSSVAIVADQPSRISNYNSPNHDYSGQNVLYIDGSVSWSKTPNCGFLSDNIYDGVTNSPSDNQDNSHILGHYYEFSHRPIKAKTNNIPLYVLILASTYVGLRLLLVLVRVSKSLRRK